MKRASTAGLRNSTIIGGMDGAARSIRSIMLMAAIVGFSPSLAAAQSVTGTGDVIPAVPSPPLPNWDLGVGELTVGNTGTGTLRIEGGASVKNGTGFIARAAGSEGEVTVTGAGSTWTNNLLGILRGKGTLTISNGAKVNVGSIINIAEQAGSEGMVLVTGQGSLFTGSNQFVLGAFGDAKATMIVEDGARVESGGFAIIANTNTTQALAVVRGANTVWHNANQFTIGANQSAQGTLRIEDGGLVETGGPISIAGGTSTGTVFIDAKSRFEGGSTFAQGANGTYIVGVADGTAGLIQVAGAATIAAGAKLQANLGGSATYRTGDRFLVLDAASVADNAYTLVNAGAVSSFLSIDDAYDPANGDVFIEVTVTRSLTEAALTPNQTATAEGAESSSAAGGLFQTLQSDAEVREALDQASGEAHASIKSMLTGDSQFLRDAVTNRLRVASTSGGEAMAMAAPNGDGRIEPAADIVAAEHRFDFWISGFGSWGDWDGDGNAADFDRSVAGVFLGADANFDDWRLGGVIGYSKADFDVDDRNSSGSARSYHVGVYGGTMWDAIALRTGASYTWNDIETRRNVTIPAAQELEADYGAHLVQVFAELAYVADLGGLVLEPFANVAYVNLHTNSFEEHGGTLALEGGSDSADSLSTTLGLRPETSFLWGDMNTRLRGLVGWRHTFGDITPDASLAFGGGDDFTVRGVPMARDTAVLEAGFDMALSDGVILGAAYQGEFGDGVSDNGFTARVDVKW